MPTKSRFKKCWYTSKNGKILHVILGADEKEANDILERKVQEEIKGLRTDSHGVKISDGRLIFIDEVPIIENGEYVWDKAGNKIKGERFLTTQMRTKKEDGYTELKITERVFLKKVWMIH